MQKAYCRSDHLLSLGKATSLTGRNPGGGVERRASRSRERRERQLTTRELIAHNFWVASALVACFRTSHGEESAKHSRWLFPPPVDVFHDPLLHALVRAVELPLHLLHAVPPRDEQSRDDEGVGLVPGLLELLPGVGLKELVPGNALRVAPVEGAGGAEDLAVERQSLDTGHGRHKKTTAHEGKASEQGGEVNR